jgi:nucleoside-diphosphate-sugar epimerase
LLLYEGAEVLCADPFIPEDSAKGKQLVPQHVAAACSLVFIGCPHSEYKKLEFKAKQRVVDCWGISSMPRLPVRKREVIPAKPFDCTQGPKKKILVTGCHGFIMGYVIPILLENGHEVWGVDNYWKYGKLAHGYDNHPNFHFTEGDAKDKALLSKLLEDNQINIFVAAAAIIGGIAMFHKLAYFLLSENEKITCAAFDACVEAYNGGKGALEKIMVISSSMVFESCDVFPSAESDLPKCPPPQSTYGFQKLACEYFAKGAYEQHGLPYVIVRPFNAVGVGERRAVVADGCEVLSGNVKLTMSHVVPDIVQKILHGQKPLHILGSGQQRRHYTYAGDLAQGMVQCMLDPRAVGHDYNVSTPKGHTVMELAEVIWKRLRPNEEFSVVSDDPFEYDVQCRVPDVEKSTRELGIECNTSLETALDEIVPWIKEQMELGTI